jgi:hypothetical protein
MLAILGSGSIFVGMTHKQQQKLSRYERESTGSVCATYNKSCFECYDIRLIELASGKCLWSITHSGDLILQGMAKSLRCAKTKIIKNLEG